MHQLPVQNILAITEELVQVPSGLQKLDTGFNELEKVSPGLIHSVLPAGNLSSFTVTLSDESITKLVRCGDTVLAKLVGFP